MRLIVQIDESIVCQCMQHTGECWSNVGPTGLPNYDIVFIFVNLLFMFAY